MRNQYISTPTEKTCTKCRVVRPRREFDCHWRTSDGLRHWCRACLDIKARQRHPNKPLAGTRQCSACFAVLPLTEFYTTNKHVMADGTRERGHTYVCKPCSVRVVTLRFAKRKHAPQSPAAEKRCAACGETKNRTEFTINRAQIDWMDPCCRPCQAESRIAQDRQKYNRGSHLRRKYGITQAQYDAMFEDQRGLCAICSLEMSNAAPMGASNKPCIDHSHGTGKVRQLLCRHCNWWIGHLENEVAGWRAKGLAYLERHGSPVHQ